MITVDEQLKHNSMRHWTLTGKNRLVKVVSPAANQAVLSYGSAMGYVTLEKYLYGKNTHAIEKILGLRPLELRQLAHVYALERLPTADEFEFRLTCAFPDGRVFDDAGRAQMAQARDAFDAGSDLYERSLTPVRQYYPPGSNQVFQWQLTSPVPVSHRIATVTEIIPFPRANGSIKPYTPHNRGEIR